MVRSGSTMCGVTRAINHPRRDLRLAGSTRRRLRREVAGLQLLGPRHLRRHLRAHAPRAAHPPHACSGGPRRLCRSKPPVSGCCSGNCHFRTPTSDLSTSPRARAPGKSEGRPGIPPAHAGGGACRRRGPERAASDISVAHDARLCAVAAARLGCCDRGRRAPPRVVDHDALAEAARRSRRLKGAERARALPPMCSALAESPGESLLRLRLLRMGLEVTEQYSMPWVEGEPRVDFLVDGRLVVEFDGRGEVRTRGRPGSRALGGEAPPRPDRRGRQRHDPRRLGGVVGRTRSARRVNRALAHARTTRG